MNSLDPRIEKQRSDEIISKPTESKNADGAHKTTKIDVEILQCLIRPLHCEKASLAIQSGSLCSRKKIGP